ncbi:hypothetical protein C8R47DRAFT_435713 [Mycena vitilis]|nr:hypothetical protein C8R47DRAFT_435713 [Mycena vitilis]
MLMSVEGCHTVTVTSCQCQSLMPLSMAFMPRTSPCTTFVGILNVIPHHDSHLLRLAADGINTRRPVHHSRPLFSTSLRTTSNAGCGDHHYPVLIFTFTRLCKNEPAPAKALCAGINCNRTSGFAISQNPFPNPPTSPTITHRPWQEVLCKTCFASSVFLPVSMRNRYRSTLTLDANQVRQVADKSIKAIYVLAPSPPLTHLASRIGSHIHLSILQSFIDIAPSRH